MTPNMRGALYALAGFAFFATHDVIIKVLGSAMSSQQMVFFSVLLSFPLVTMMMLHETQAHTLRPRHPGWTALRTAAVVLTAVSAFYAFSTLPLAQTYAILFAAPLMITMLSVPILGETVRLRRWIAVLVGLGGVLIVLRPGSEPLSLGHAAALLAAFGSALASIIVRKIGKDERSDVLLLYPMLANFVLMGATLPWTYTPMEFGEFALLAALSALAFAAMLCIIAAYRHGEAVTVAPMQYSQILWAVLFGALLFDEHPDLTTGIGAAVIIASGLYIVLRENRSGSSQEPVLRTRTRFETGTLPRVGVMLRFRKDPD
ncbi:MAG: DMT family transporter [Marinibacterium sp.]|nr:DMT family transporter [Marinibacterium sp.]